VSALAFSAEAFAIALGAGFLGSLLGIGGGIIIVPALTLLMGVDIRFAIGASIVSVVATSSGSAVTFVKKAIANVKLAMILEVATVSGALVGAFLGTSLPRENLYLLFGLLLFLVATLMVIRRNAEDSSRAPSTSDLARAQKLDLVGHYEDVRKGQVNYVVRRIGAGQCASFVAGILSGLLGVGGGIVKVPVMNVVMGVPLKVATATSNLMIGVTAAASALVYVTRGDINPFVATPVALGVLAGAQLGSRIMTRIESRIILRLFVVILVWMGGQMCWKWWSSTHG